MSHDPDQNLDPELQGRIRRLPRPSPDPAFRERVRDRFLAPASGPLAGRLSARKTWVWSGGALAAAAVLAIGFATLLAGPTWTIREVTAQGPVLVGADSMTAEECTGRELEDGTRLRGCAKGHMDLEVDSGLSLVLGPGAEATVGSARRFPGGSLLTAAVHRGTVYGTTGPGFPGAGLLIETDHALIHVKGTTFAVLGGPDTTCVCVLSGTVEVTVKETGERMQVPADQQLFVSSGERAPRFLPLTPAQRSELVRIRDRGSL